jgi:hypothetical protein
MSGLVIVIFSLSLVNLSALKIAILIKDEH